MAFCCGHCDGSPRSENVVHTNGGACGGRRNRLAEGQDFVKIQPQQERPKHHSIDTAGNGHLQ